MSLFGAKKWGYNHIKVENPHKYRKNFKKRRLSLSKCSINKTIKVSIHAKIEWVPFL